MFRNITNQHKCIFAAGAATAVAVLGFLKTEKARNLAVKSVANTILLKDVVLENVANIKEEAQDIVCEAKTVAKNECNCDESCDC